jgi:hypothetical protein
MIISTISGGSLVAGDEGVVGVSGEALEEYMLRILARLRNQTRLASSSIASGKNGTRLSRRTLGGECQDYLIVKMSGFSLTTSRLLDSGRPNALRQAGQVNLLFWCPLEPLSTSPSQTSSTR